MKEISEGQVWYPNIDYHGWGAVYINEKLKNDRWVVDIATDPPTRDIIMTTEQIHRGYYHKYEIKSLNIEPDSVPTHETILSGTEPDRSQYINYSSREREREKVYGGKPPNGFSSWGDYWKSY